MPGRATAFDGVVDGVGGDGDDGDDGDGGEEQPPPRPRTNTQRATAPRMGGL
jgi:hypothetical protein